MTEEIVRLLGRNERCIAGEHQPVFAADASRLNTKQCVMRLVVVLIEVMRVLGSNKRDLEFMRKRDERSLNFIMVFDLRLLHDLDKIILFAEYFLILTRDLDSPLFVPV